jgi:hypothetical protein
VGVRLLDQGDGETAVQRRGRPVLTHAAVVTRRHPRLGETLVAHEKVDLRVGEAGVPDQGGVGEQLGAQAALRRCGHVLEELGEQPFADWFGDRVVGDGDVRRVGHHSSPRL